MAARFRIELSEDNWMWELSRAHPEATFRLLSGIEEDGRALELGEIRARPASAVVDALRDHPAVGDLDLLHAVERRALARYEVEDAGLYRFLRATGVPPEFPIEARDGWFEVELTASRDRLQAMHEALSAGPSDHEVLFVAEAGGDDALLTDRQREALEAAHRSGFFEVPRETSLRELAEDLGVDESSLSGLLRRAQHRVVDRFLSDPARRIGR